MKECKHNCLVFNKDWTCKCYYCGKVIKEKQADLTGGVNAPTEVFRRLQPTLGMLKNRLKNTIQSAVFYEVNNELCRKDK